MYDLLLATHYFGLAIGAGTPFYMAAIAAQAGKSGNPAVIKEVMLGPGSAVSMVGAVGLVLLILSGILMMVVNSMGQLGWEFTAKMIVVVAITLFVGIMKRLSKKAKNEEGMQSMATIKKLSPIGPLLSLAVIGLAVMAFH